MHIKNLDNSNNALLNKRRKRGEEKSNMSQAAGAAMDI